MSAAALCKRGEQTRLRVGRRSDWLNRDQQHLTGDGNYSRFYKRDHNVVSFYANDVGVQSSGTVQTNIFTHFSKIKPTTKQFCQKFKVKLCCCFFKAGTSSSFV